MALRQRARRVRLGYGGRTTDPPLPRAAGGRAEAARRPHASWSPGSTSASSTTGATYELCDHSLGGRHGGDRTGYRLIERFHLDGTTPVWHYACADALIEKRVWMEPGANTTYVRYRAAARRGGGPVRLALRALVNYRDFHATTHAGRLADGGGRRSRTGCASPPTTGARPLVGSPGRPPRRRRTTGICGFRLARRGSERGLDALDDNLHVGTFRGHARAGRVRHRGALGGGAPSLDGERPGRAGARTRPSVLLAWRAGAARAAAPALDRAARARRRPVRRRAARSPPIPAALSVIAGYHWFGDWGRDTMIACPG